MQFRDRASGRWAWAQRGMVARRSTGASPGPLCTRPIPAVLALPQIGPRASVYTCNWICTTIVHLVCSFVTARRADGRGRSAARSRGGRPALLQGPSARAPFRLCSHSLKSARLHIHLHLAVYNNPYIFSMAVHRVDGHEHRPVQSRGRACLQSDTSRVEPSMPPNNITQNRFQPHQSHRDDRQLKDNRITVLANTDER